jgi:hypothetical protein
VHSVLNALIDVQSQGCSFIILDNPFGDTNRCVAMLLYSFERRTKSLIAKPKFFFVVVDPVIRTRTEERMLPLEMRMLVEAQLAPPLHLRGR